MNQLPEDIRKEFEQNQVKIDEANESLLCPGCNHPVAHIDALKYIDEPVPKYCPNCGHKLHY